MPNHNLGGGGSSGGSGGAGSGGRARKVIITRKPSFTDLVSAVAHRTTSLGYGTNGEEENNNNSVAISKKNDSVVRAFCGLGGPSEVSAKARRYLSPPPKFQQQQQPTADFHTGESSVLKNLPVFNAKHIFTCKVGETETGHTCCSFSDFRVSRSLWPRKGASTESERGLVLFTLKAAHICTTGRCGLGPRLLPTLSSFH